MARTGPAGGPCRKRYVYEGRIPVNSGVKIGYPCINYTVPCRGNRTFRLASYSVPRFMATVADNLSCLGRVLAYNAAHGFLFFRLSSDLVPFASHPVCTTDWEQEFSGTFDTIGAFIRDHGMRISMHPDQFVLLNARDPAIVERSVAELDYHARLVDALGLPHSAKIQIHVGGVYGDRDAAVDRFVANGKDLDRRVRDRLVIENDDRSYTAGDCLRIAGRIRVPVLFDAFHHEVNGSGHALPDALILAARTWKKRDGLPLVDYSSQQPGARKGTHAQELDPDHFRRFLAESKAVDFDLMLEIKAKERAAAAALRIASGDPRLVR